MRAYVGEECLIRPGDRLVAVGRGWQQSRNVAELLVERERPACPDDAPYGLWATFDEPLPEDPIFVTTDPSVQSGDNLFVPAEQVPVAAASAEIIGRFRGLVQFPEEYRVTLMELGFPEAQTLVLFERREIRSDDDGLPAMTAALMNREGIQLLWTERVDGRRGTGKFEFVGSLDFDGDGVRELVINGVHAGCPYTLVFRRAAKGFEPLPLPVRSCAC